MEINSSEASACRTEETLARDLAAALVANFTAIDDVLQGQYENGSWTTPDRVAERLQGTIAARILSLVTAIGPGTMEVVETLARTAEKLRAGGPLDPWDVLAFRAPVDFRSHRVVLTDPPALSPEVQAVQAQLLRRGVAVLGEHESGGQRVLELSSYVEDWAYSAAGELLSDLEPDWLARTAREIKPVSCAGWREKGENLIRLWISLEGGEHIDEVLAAEDDAQIAILAFACTPAAGCVGQPRHDPVSIHLERPLGGRVVVDGFSGDLVPQE